MFTGLIQKLVPVVSIEGDAQGIRLSVQKPAEFSEPGQCLQLGESIAINGACLTVTSFDAQKIEFFMGQETLLKTTLGALKKGDQVNVERSLMMGDRLGGHMVSGHVDQTATVVGRENRGACLWLQIKVNREQFKYLVPKGSVTLNGVSLTVNSIEATDQTFEVLLIPETLERTNLAAVQVDHLLNIEFDQMVKIVAQQIDHFLKHSQNLAALPSSCGVQTGSL